MPLAAAGLAEYAWMMDMVLMMGAMIVVAILALTALATWSRKLALAAIAILFLFAIFFQPWYCFAPFDLKDYDDPDVESAAGSFRTLGFLWIATSVFAITSLVIIWFNTRRRNGGWHWPAQSATTEDALQHD